MKITIDVPDYSPERGLRIEWETEAVVRASIESGTMRLVANKDGLVALARMMLTLANPDVPLGHHCHLDELNHFEEGSNELIIEKM